MSQGSEVSAVSQLIRRVTNEKLTLTSQPDQNYSETKVEIQIYPLPTTIATSYLYLESFLPGLNSSRSHVCYFHHHSLSVKKQHLILTDWQIYTQIRFGFKNNSTQERLTRRDVMKMPQRNRKTCDFPISHAGFADWVRKLIWNVLFSYRKFWPCE